MTPKVHFVVEGALDSARRAQGAHQPSVSDLVTPTIPDLRTESRVDRISFGTGPVRDS